ncbi:MAG: MFS transporter, partial [Bauldia sp.]
MRSTLAPISALLLGVLFLIIGHGLQITLIPLRATAEGWSPLAVGVVGSAYYVGFVLGCLAAPFAILRAGHIRAFAALVALTAATTLGQGLIVAIVPWIAFRLIVGACLAGLYMVIESWLNDRASNADRGLIMSTYIVVNFIAITAGQFMATLAPPTAFTLFAAASLVISLATIPVALTKSAQPAPITLVRFRPKALYRSSPVGMVGVTVVGIANGAFWSLAAVYAIGEGLSSVQAAIFTG